MSRASLSRARRRTRYAASTAPVWTPWPWMTSGSRRPEPPAPQLSRSGNSFPAAEHEDVEGQAGYPLHALEKQLSARLEQRPRSHGRHEQPVDRQTRRRLATLAGEGIEELRDHPGAVGPAVGLEIERPRVG